MRIGEEAVRAAARGMQPTAGNHQVNCPTYMLQPFSECTCGIWANTLFRARAALEAAQPYVEDKPELDREAVDKALRTVMAWVDYDLHKSLERDEETGEDTYAEHVDRFMAAYEREVGS